MVGAPEASRPHMPGYGVVDATEGGGLLPWSWAEERLTASHDYWVGTVWPDGRPHLMPVWATWWGQALWFSSGGRSRKARNLAAEPRVTVATDNPLEPVVVEGVADRVVDRDLIAGFLDRLNAKYATDYPLEFLDPSVNYSFRVSPVWVFGLREADFTGSPTCWRFG